MLQHGRKSPEALTVVARMPGQRPDPPAELTEEQAVEWRAIAGRMPPNWFTAETLPLLGQLCRHIVACRMIGAKLSAFKAEWLKDDEGLKRFEKLTRIHEREGRAMTSIATRLRLTPQTRFNEQKAKAEINRSAGDRPWEDED